MALAALFFIAGCASIQKVERPFSAYASPWHGRLSLRIKQAQGQEQALAAEFELSGNAQMGELTLHGPLGSTVAALSWSPQSASMRANGDIQYFGSLNELVRTAVGTDIPVGALFAWVAGENQRANGWSADLSDYPRGRIKAYRQGSVPAAELNLILSRSSGN